MTTEAEISSKPLSKEQALTLVGALAQAAAKTALVENDIIQGSLKMAARHQYYVAKAILVALTDEPVDSDEIQAAFGW